MPQYVAFLRGINVGGKNMIKMERLREIVAALGFENVRTYVNSGNVVFETKRTANKRLAQQIHIAINEEFGMDISVMTRSMSEIKKIVARNPYEGQFENDKDVHVFFLNNELTPEQSSLLLANSSDKELITLDGPTIYYLLRMSILDSTLGKGFIDRKLKVAATARNWRTVKTLSGM